MPNCGRSAHATKHLARLLFCVTLLTMCPPQTISRTDRVDLFPKLRPGQTLDYEISYRNDKRTKTESSFVVAEAPPAAKIEVRGLLHLEILDVAAQGQRALIHARTRFESLNSQETKLKLPNTESPPNQTPPQNPGETPIEFTIFPDGRIDQIQGLDALSPEQQQAWQEWASRFAGAAVFPAGGIKLAQKWKSDEPEKSPSPIAGLIWTRESTYVRNEPCRAAQITAQGDIVESPEPPETCAVILTTSTLKQQSSSKDATPEDFQLHQLRTKGTTRGSNKTITYISLETGLVVRASDEADQSMTVTIAKSDGTNRVHYDIHAQSVAEILLLAGTPLKNP